VRQGHEHCGFVVMIVCRHKPYHSTPDKETSSIWYCHGL